MKELQMYSYYHGKTFSTFSKAKLETIMISEDIGNAKIRTIKVFG